MHPGIREKLYQMNLFDELVLDANRIVLRVPGGWIFEYHRSDFEYHRSDVVTCFVPFNNEFQEQKK